MDSVHHYVKHSNRYGVILAMYEDLYRCGFRVTKCVSVLSIIAFVAVWLVGKYRTANEKLYRLSSKSRLPRNCCHSQAGIEWGDICHNYHWKSLQCRDVTAWRCLNVLEQLVTHLRAPFMSLVPRRICSWKLVSLLCVTDKSLHFVYLDVSRKQYTTG